MDNQEMHLNLLVEQLRILLESANFSLATEKTNSAIGRMELDNCRKELQNSSMEKTRLQDELSMYKSRFGDLNVIENEE